MSSRYYDGHFFSSTLLAYFVYYVQLHSVSLPKMYWPIVFFFFGTGSFLNAEPVSSKSVIYIWIALADGIEHNAVED